MNIYSMGRGQEATVSQDALCPPGGTYPILAAQDIGAPMRGTFIRYPADIATRFVEFLCTNLEYAASDPSFVVARSTDQNTGLLDTSCYSTNYGADGTWVLPSGTTPTPTSLWQATITATIDNGSGGSGQILHVTAINSGTRIFPWAWITQNADASGTFYGRVEPYGTSSTTGTGGIGTYFLDTAQLVASPTAMCSFVPCQGGQTVAVDHDHWLAIPAGLAAIGTGHLLIPAFTTNATQTSGAGCTWALSTGIPPGSFYPRPWTYGPTCKPFAVGYGADLHTVWACNFGGNSVYTGGTGTATLYRSIDSGASFNPIATWAVSANAQAIYCLSVPGYPNELWISGSYSSGPNAGLWHVTNANTTSATATPITLPAAILAPARHSRLVLQPPWAVNQRFIFGAMTVLVLVQQVSCTRGRLLVRRTRQQRL